MESTNSTQNIIFKPFLLHYMDNISESNEAKNRFFLL